MRTPVSWILLGTVVALLSADPSLAGEKKEQPAPDLGALFRIHYDTRVRAFREQNQVFRNVVLVGDSITEGFEVPKYFPGRRVLNRGIGGMSSETPCRQRIPAGS